MDKDKKLLELEIKERSYYVTILESERNRCKDNDMQKKMTEHLLNEVKELRRLRRIRDFRNDENVN